MIDRRTIRVVAGIGCVSALVAFAAVVIPESARAQTIPPKGAEATFDVATWNIEWFGSEQNGPADEQLQLENVRRVIVESEIDLWAVQEIDDRDHFDALLAALGEGYAGTLGPSSTNLRVGFIYRTDVVDPITVNDAWLKQFSDDFGGRPPLLMLADVILADTTVELYIVSLHMKAFGDPDSYAKRLEASTRLKLNIDNLRANDPFLILGDFNDELSGSTAGSNPSPYTNFLDDPDNYRFTSLHLDENDEETWCDNAECTSGSIFDHILITNELFDHYVDGSTDRYIELLDAISQYVSTTPDHLPVFASFSFATHTSVETPDATAFRLDSIHPNPASDRATLAYSLERPAEVRIELFDLLGRRLAVLQDGVRPAGKHREEIDAARLPPGVYFVSMMSPVGRRVAPLVIAE